MQIEGLTEAQVEMLDFMWYELDTEQDFLEWYECLDTAQKRMADMLQRMVILEALDVDMMSQTSFPEAKSVLDNIAKL